jgi:DNA polymerase V
MIALSKIFRQGFGYRSVMIILSKLTSTGLQNELWQDGLDAEKKRKFMNHIDDLSKEYGRNVVSVARSIQKGEWGMSRTRLSKCYTTRISDIPVVK